jgi:hypothetical protein
MKLMKGGEKGKMCDVFYFSGFFFYVYDLFTRGKKDDPLLTTNVTFRTRTYTAHMHACTHMDTHDTQTHTPTHMTRTHILRVHALRFPLCVCAHIW